MREPTPSVGSGDSEELMPFEDIDVEAATSSVGPAPSGRSLSAAERAEIERQLPAGGPEPVG
jgi:hypothetical protein